ncbi:MAG: hypothetical protein CMJ94_11270 [Planctomycetes bacterium]|nr:hypothetical protein [Planctomycetota bacterium]
MYTPPPDQLLRLRIALDEVQPEVWREIEVSMKISFWQLHVAIQDAMGWQDRHLHAFERRKYGGPHAARVGIPDPDLEDRSLPAWNVPVSIWLEEEGDSCCYRYDFGDDWMHTIEVVARSDVKKSVRLPRCVAGAGICPPEDCGGPFAIEERVAAGDWPPEGKEFDPKRVQFSDPEARLERLFGGGGV